MQVRNGYGWLVALGAVALVGSGCSGDDDRRGGGGRDGGIMIMEDGGTDGSTRPDSGSTPDGGGEGMCTDVGDAAWSNPAPCTAELGPCLNACPMGDSTCVDNCYAMQDPQCRQCITIEVIGCAQRNGCREEINCFFGCIDANCTDAMGNVMDGCPDAMCASEGTDLDTCFEGVDVAGLCGRQITSTCVQPPTGGGGSGGGGM